jgi:hypothetical protein
MANFFIIITPQRRICRFQQVMRERGADSLKRITKKNLATGLHGLAQIKGFK